MTPQTEIQLIAVAAAAACALSGTFLVLRRMAMIADAVSHAVLPGIVIAFLLGGGLGSPLLAFGAALSGVATVALVEALQRTKLVKEDTAIGLVFPALFAFGVVLVSRYADHVHLDVDAVLLGELAFAPFERMIIAGRDVGPRALWIAGGALVLNVAAVSVFFKELKLVTFDPALAAALGFSPLLLHYGLMTLVSATAVASFDAVGLVLVVALMVGPAAAAWLLTDRLAVLLPLAAGLGATSAVAGYWLARWFDASIAGAMAVCVGLVFLLVFSFAPRRGLLARRRMLATQRREFAMTLLAVHLAQHEGTVDEADESRLASLHLHLHWDEDRLRRTVRDGLNRGWLRREDDRLLLEDAGRSAARTVFARAWPQGTGTTPHRI